jgi:hypothetical protein
MENGLSGLIFTEGSDLDGRPGSFRVTIRVDGNGAAFVGSVIAAYSRMVIPDGPAHEIMKAATAAQKM